MIELASGRGSRRSRVQGRWLVGSSIVVEVADVDVEVVPVDSNLAKLSQTTTITSCDETAIRRESHRIILLFLAPQGRLSERRPAYKEGQARGPLVPGSCQKNRNTPKIGQLFSQHLA